MGRAVEGLLSGYGLQLADINTMEDLDRLADDAVLILISLQGVSDGPIDLPRYLRQNPRLVADIVALTEDITPEERSKVLAAGFTSIFNTSFMTLPDFKQILLNRVERGFHCLENRIQQDEYARFKAALSASPDAFILFDKNNKIFFVSEHYRKAYPKSGMKLVRGLDVMDAFTLCTAEEGVDENDPRYAVMKAFWQKMDGQAEYRTADGRIWHIKARKLPDGHGTIVTTTDITHYKEQQQALRDKTEQLADALEKEQEASAIQKQFVNMVSHEFRTPLSIIDGNAQLLQRRASTANEAAIIEKTKTIRSAVSRLVNLMEGVLSSNMLKTGKLEPIPEPVNLRGLIEELCAEHRDLYTEHRINCDVAGLPDTVVLDRKLITLVVSNLLSNAVKFTKKNPEIDVKGWVEDGLIHLRFEDNGIGIPPNEIDRVFDRYYRATTSSGIPGTGIGLNLVKDLVELHGGKINVDSEMNRGTKFEIFLPLSE
ncbi:MAG: PAS-domain containing protein [Rhodospirillales bacterium]|nr:PAS-domain containing protein [Rhodospirillales bacterium]